MENIFRFIHFDFKHKWRTILYDILVLSVLWQSILKISDWIKGWLVVYGLHFDSPASINITFFFLWLVFLFGLTKLLFNIIFSKNTLRNKDYRFKNDDWPSGWIYNGKTEILNGIDKLYVKSSRAGCLLKTHEWKNFRMTFDLKFEVPYKHNQQKYNKYVGIIFRAEDLDNYFMLEVCQGHYDGYSGLKPHVRFRGAWELMDYEINAFDFTEFVNLCLEVNGDNVYLFYAGDKVLTWILPTHVDINHIESGVRQTENQDRRDVLIMGEPGNVQEIPFRLSYGMVGFRAHPEQGAIIRGLKVEPL